jgi:putative ABC transport system permease protein
MAALIAWWKTEKTKMDLYRIKRILKLSARSLWLHRLRSILTALGIIFGVSSVIAMLAIGEGASQEAQAQIARLGSTNIIIETVRPPEDQNPGTEDRSSRAYGLTYDDAKRFRSVLPHIDVVVPIRKINEKVWYRNRTVAIDVIGTVPWYVETSPMRINRGRFLSDTDLHYQQGVCVIDEQVAEQLFAIDDPLDKHIKCKNKYYRVIGIASAIGPIDISGTDNLELTSHSTGGGVAGNIYIALATFKSRFGEMKVEFSGGSQSIEKVELEQITVKVQSLDQVMPVSQAIERLLDKAHKKKDYKITVPLELLRQSAQTKRIFSIVLGSIAAISLIVGGIGIMNIMLATVSERTREIGIRRALGAKRKDIIIQFLTETVMLTLTGGVLGIGLGCFIPSFITYFGKMPTIITTSSLILAFGISAIVGITFGWYPAYRAAHMDPIESLRHE